MLHAPVHFTPTAGLKGEFGAQAGWHGRGWSCLWARELMPCKMVTYDAEGGDNESKPPSHPHRLGMTTSAQQSSHL